MSAGGPSGVVLAGAATLGAYQVGVLEHLVDHVARELDGGLDLEVLSGTSVGAIHAAAMASDIDCLGAAIARMREAWQALRLEQQLRPSAVELLSMLSDFAGRATSVRRVLRALGARGGIVDARPVRRLCEAAVDGGRIAEQLHRSRLRGVAVAATQVSTGRATVFYQARISAARSSVMTPVELTPSHVLASASMPALFPAVDIDRELYCDGGLRRMVPLSPALHLGARRVLMVSAVARVDDATVAAVRRAAVSSPLYLAGKALDALFSDGVESDLDRLLHINRLLEWGPDATDPASPHRSMTGWPPPARRRCARSRSCTSSPRGISGRSPPSTWRARRSRGARGGRWRTSFVASPVATRRRPAASSRISCSTLASPPS